MSRLTALQLLLAGLTASAWLYTRRKRPMRRIANECILIIGASSGVGREIALEYAKRKDVTLILVARRPLDAIVKDCLALGCSAAVGVQADASESEDVVRLMAEIQRKYSHLDTVVFWWVACAMLVVKAAHKPDMAAPEL